MTWVKLLLKGVKYTFEVVNFICFISEEGCQTATMAMGTALSNNKKELSHEIADTTLQQTQDELLWNFMLYGMKLLPHWRAYACFWYANKTNVMKLNQKLYDYDKLWALGLDPNIKPGSKQKK